MIRAYSRKTGLFNTIPNLHILPNLGVILYTINITNKKKVQNTTAIKRIIKKFEEEVTVLDLRAQNERPSTITPDKKIREKEYFEL